MISQIPHRNQSPFGWWIATYVLRTSWDNEIESSPETTCLVWKNTIILQAPDREAAYTKAVNIGSNDVGEFQDDSNPPRNGHWVFEGLSSLLPIYEELVDGAEILWAERDGVPLSEIRSWVKSKSNLEAFNDAQNNGDRA